MTATILADELPYISLYHRDNVAIMRKNVGGFARRADEIIAEELSVSPELRILIQTLVEARRASAR